jgi:uncharacterized protein (TIGR02466 family)
MSCKIVPLFPTPLYISEIGKVTEDELRNVENLDYEEMMLKNGDSSIDRYILQRPEFSRLKDEIDTHVVTYCHDILKISKNIQFIMTNSWIVKHEPGDWAQDHIHTNSLMSGVTYLQVPENSGAIEFHYERNEFFFPPSLSLEFTEPNELNCQAYLLQPKQNLITLFPSKLRHSVRKNESNEKRYCLAFNYFIRGHLGEKDYELHLP